MPTRGVRTARWRPASIAMPSAMNTAPITTVANLAFDSTQLVTYSEIRPTATNTLMKPAATDPETANARRTPAR